MPVFLGNTNFGLDYKGAFAAGFILLILFCYERFGQPVDDGSFVSKLLPAHLAAKQDYLKAFLIYLVLMLSIYSVLSFVGPYFFQACDLAKSGEMNLGTAGFSATSGKGEGSGISDLKDVFTALPQKDAPAVIPLVLMLILSGASTQYRHLNKVEVIIRKLMHRCIGIPEGIESLASRISQAKLNVDNLSAGDAELLRQKYLQVTGSVLKDVTEFDSTLRNKEEIKDWIRLQFLFKKLENRRQVFQGAIDIGVFDYYEDIWNKIRVSAYRLMDKSYRNRLNLGAQAADPADLDLFMRIRTQINDTLNNIHALIAVSIANRSQQSGAISGAMNRLGLESKNVSKDNSINCIIVSILLMIAAVFVTTWATPLFVKWLKLEVAYPFPRTAADSFAWATGAVALNGFAAIVAWNHRAWIVKRGKWEVLSFRKMQIPAVQYLLLAVWAYLAATLALLFWYLTKEVMTHGVFPAWGLRMTWIPLFGLVGAFNGGWVAYTLDLALVRTASARRLLVQPVIQGLSMACMGYFAMAIFNADPGRWLFNLYLGAVIGIEGLIIGASVVLITWSSSKREEIV